MSENYLKDTLDALAASHQKKRESITKVDIKVLKHALKENKGLFWEYIKKVLKK